MNPWRCCQIWQLKILISECQHYSQHGDTEHKWPFIEASRVFLGYIYRWLIWKDSLYLMSLLYFMQSGSKHFWCLKHHLMRDFHHIMDIIEDPYHTLLTCGELRKVEIFYTFALSSNHNFWNPLTWKQMISICHFYSGTYDCNNNSYPRPHLFPYFV